MKRLLLLIFTVLIIRQISSEEILKINEYLKIIEEKLPDIKINQNKVEMQEIAVNKSYSIYDTNAMIKAYGQGTQSYPDNENVINDYSPTFGGEFTFTNKLPSGTELSTGFTYTQNYSSKETTVTNAMTGTESVTEWEKATYTPTIKIGVTQPLLNNWFGFLDRYGIKNEKNQLLIEKLTQELNNESLMTDFKKIYFQWIALSSKLELIDKTIDNANKQFSQTKQKVNLGLLEKDSIETANYSILKYQKQKEEYIKDYEYLKNQLAYFIDIDNYKPDLTFFENTFDKDYKSVVEYLDFSKTQSALILNLSKENHELLKKANINQVMPSLDLFANLDINFRYAREVDEGEVSEYYYNDNNYNNINFTAGIELTVPLGNISARNSLKKTKLMIEDVLLEYEKTKKSYDNNISNVIAFDNYLKKIIKNNIDSIKSLTLKYSIQQNQYKKGLADLDDLVMTDNSITTEKMNEINYKVDLINNFIDYQYLTK